MIQEGINQILSNIGVIAGLGSKPGLQAMEDKRKFIQSKKSLQDITKNLEEVDRGERVPYTEEEEADIEARRRSDIKDIYDVKTKELGGGVYGSIVGKESEEFKHADIADLNKRYEQAKASLKEKAEAKLKQDEELEELKKQMLEKDEKSKEFRKQVLQGTPSEFSENMKPRNTIGGNNGTK